MYFVFIRQKRNIQGCSIVTKLQTPSLEVKSFEYSKSIYFPNLYTVGVLSSITPTTVCSIGKPTLLPTDHVEPVRKVSVLTGNLTSSVWVSCCGAELHSYPREFADLEVVTSLGGELEGSDELVAGCCPVLAQTDGGVYPLADLG